MDTAQFLDIFIDESTEHLDTLYEQLLELEKRPEDLTIIEEIFRAAHTIKGMSATMGYDDIANLTHRLENIFDGIREEKIFVQANMMDYMFEAVDHLNDMVEDIANGGDGSGNVDRIVRQLERIEHGELFVEEKESNEEAAVEQSVDSAHEHTEITLDEFQITVLEESNELGFQNVQITVHLSETCLLKGVRAYMVFELFEKMGDIVHANPSVHDIEEENFDLSFSTIFVTKHSKTEIEERVLKITEVESVDIKDFSIEDYTKQREQQVVEHTVTDVESTEETTEEQKEQRPVRAAVQTKTIRVNIERLDRLMNLFEELVIDRGRLEQIAVELEHYDLQETVERMSRVSSDLQSIILTMRMIPIDNVFSRFPRMVRQLARELDKEIDVDIIGAETELDRTVIDEIGDPLVHLIRNAVDHGIETPDVRARHGKPETGTITLEAYHSGNFVFVEISDDGAGINPERIKQIAIEKGLIAASDAEQLSNEETFALMLESGFSTNEEVSDISGRGVGLDVVKNTIESLGGTLTIQSELGEGTTFSVQLPLTLSIISVLLVQLAEEKYAIPLSSVIETVNTHTSEIFSAHNNKVIDFRGKVVPLAFLRNIFEVSEDPYPSEYVQVVIVRRGEKLTGLVVDSLIGQQEVVLKSLGNYLSNTFAISGATILGDGGVALIVDSNALIK